MALKEYRTLAALARQAIHFTRSRRKLVSLILEKPETRVAILVQIAGEDLGTTGVAVAKALGEAVETFRSLDFWRLVYREVAPKSAHFTELAVYLSNALLEDATHRRPIPRKTQAALMENLSEHLRDARMPRLAVVKAEASVKVWRQVAKDEPNLRYRWIGALLRLSKHYAEAGHFPRALVTNRRAVSAAESPRTAEDQKVLAESLLALGSRLADLQKFGNALPALERGYRLFRDLLSVDENLRSDWSRAALMYADALVKSGDCATAEEPLAAALAHLRRHIADNRGGLLEPFIWALSVDARAAAYCGDKEKAKARLEEGLSYLSALARQNPSQFAKRYIHQLLAYTSELVRDYDPADAIRWGEVTLKEIHKISGRRHPKEWELLSIAHTQLALAWRRVPDVAKARRDERKAQASLRHLPPGHPTRAKVNESLQKT